MKIWGDVPGATRVHARARLETGACYMEVGACFILICVSCSWQDKSSGNKDKDCFSAETGSARIECGQKLQGQCVLGATREDGHGEQATVSAFRQLALEF